MRDLRCPACWAAAFLITVGVLGCQRGADTGATSNPVAPGRPGSGNPVEVVRPVPGSITESPQIGGARGEIPAGVTGSGGPTDYPGQVQSRSHVPGPDAGLHGGIDPAAGSASAPSAVARQQGSPATAQR